MYDRRVVDRERVKAWRVRTQRPDITVEMSETRDPKIVRLTIYDQGSDVETQLSAELDRAQLEALRTTLYEFPQIEVGEEEGSV